MEEINGRICTKCGQFKLFEEFSRCKSGKYGRRAMCKTCEHEIQNSPEYRERRKIKRQERRQNEDYKLAELAKDLNTRHSNPDSIKKAIVRAAKRRAEAKGLPFSITYKDFELPEVCPLLEIPLQVNEGKAQDNSYSLDRIIPELGYVPGNIWVISNKANMIKNDASLETLQLLVHNLEHKLNKINEN